MSYFKEFLKEGYDTEFTRPEFTTDYERFEKTLQFFREKSSLSIKVLDAKSLILEPEKTLRDFDKWAGLESRKEALTWEASPDLFKEDKHWYGELRKSTGFSLPKKRHKIEDFPENLRPRIISLIQSNQPIYDRITR